MKARTVRPTPAEALDKLGAEGSGPQVAAFLIREHCPGRHQPSDCPGSNWIYKKTGVRVYIGGTGMWAFEEGAHVKYPLPDPVREMVSGFDHGLYRELHAADCGGSQCPVHAEVTSL